MRTIFAFVCILGVAAANDLGPHAPGLSFVARVEQDGYVRCSGYLQDRGTVVTMAGCIDDTIGIDRYRVVLLTVDGKRVVRQIDSYSALDVRGNFEVNYLVLSEKYNAIDDKVGPIKKSMMNGDLHEGNEDGCWAISYAGRERDTLLVMPMMRSEGTCQRRRFCYDVDYEFDFLCKTDSGAPVLCKHEDRWALLGIVAVESGCQRKDINLLKSHHIPMYADAFP